MYDRLNVPLSLTWEIYGDTEATFNDCFRMFNPTTREKFEEVRPCCTLHWTLCELHHFVANSVSRCSM